MNYSEILEICKQGKIGMLPNFIGYFKWDFRNKVLMFINEDFKCLAEDLDVKNRKDFYYIT